MNAFHRLHNLRMENDAAGFAMDEMRPRFERMAGRHENGTAPKAVSVYQLFQTPPEIAAQLVSAMSVPAAARILEPSAGLGRLIDAVQFLKPAEVVAVEMAPECAGELYRQSRPYVTIKQRDFLKVKPEELGLFDAVIMNPPFHIRADIQHIEYALEFLKPGGVLGAICMNTFHRQQKLKPIAERWIDLPPGAFKSSGTGVATAICIITKQNQPSK